MGFNSGFKGLNWH